MGKLFTALRNAPKRTSALFAILAAVTIVPAALLAYGPDRPTYTIEHPADHITFNSITNNPDYGDERNFVRIKDAANTAAGGWSDEINVQPGKEYLVQMYVHNNAATSLNLVAKNVNVKANVPTTTGKKVQIDGFITADNATPNQVWDQAIFNGSQDFNVAYVPGSATYYNNVFPAGTKLGDSIVTNSGAKLGYDKMDGNIPGCFQYSGYVSFKVKPQFAQKADFTVSKEVSKHGENKWSENYTAKPGETVDYLIEYRNTGDVQQNNVTVRDKLPAGMTYVNGSTKFGTPSNPGGVKASDEVTTTGINIGSWAKNAGTWVTFSAKAPETKNLVCGTNTLKNVANVETDYGTKEDSANITVPKECQPNECKPGIPVGDERCENCPIPGKENLPKDSTECVETPVTPETPTELPTTGPTETILSVIGLGALIASIGYYISSRRAIIGR